MKYSQDIKQEALSRYKCGSDSVKNIIEDLNVPRSTLYYWIKQEAVLPSCRYAKQPAVSQKKYEDLRRHTAKLEQYVSAAKDINLSSLLTLDEKLELYDLHEGKYSSKILCEVLGISRGTYSKRIVNHKNPTVSEEHRAAVKERVIEIFDKSQQRYGSDKILALLVSYIFFEHSLPHCSITVFPKSAESAFVLFTSAPRFFFCASFSSA